jgi:hypothetical protein
LSTPPCQGGSPWVCGIELGVPGGGGGGRAQVASQRERRPGPIPQWSGGRGAKGGGAYLVLPEGSGIAVGHEPRAAVVEAAVGRGRSKSRGGSLASSRHCGRSAMTDRTTAVLSRVGTRAPVRLGIRVGVQSNPSLTMPPQGRGIRRGGHHLPGCFNDIARVPNTNMCMYSHAIVGVGPHDYGGEMVGYMCPTHTVSVTYRLGVTAAR